MTGLDRPAPWIRLLSFATRVTAWLVFWIFEAFSQIALSISHDQTNDMVSLLAWRTAQDVLRERVAMV